MDINQLSEIMIGAAIEVHRALGPGLLESAYHQCVCRELSLRGVAFKNQLALPVRYKGMLLDCGYKVDLLIEDRIVVELKSVESLLPIHEAQLLTYMRLGNWELGLLINFNVPVLKDGIRRRVLNHKD
jgi:GxxExxY protein